MNTLKNKVQLIGHLGFAPEVKTMENGNKVANISLATNEQYTNAQGEKVTETQWHRLVAWGKTAELLEKFTDKGAEIAVEGRLVSRSYTDKAGQKRFITEVVINEVLLMSKKVA